MKIIYSWRFEPLQHTATSLWAIMADKKCTKLKSWAEYKWDRNTNSYDWNQHPDVV